MAKERRGAHVCVPSELVAATIAPATPCALEVGVLGVKRSPTMGALVKNTEAILAFGQGRSRWCHGIHGNIFAFNAGYSVDRLAWQSPDQSPLMWHSIERKPMPGTTQLLTLRDGRELEILTMGDPAGKTVVFQHGTPGSI